MSMTQHLKIKTSGGPSWKPKYILPNKRKTLYTQLFFGGGIFAPPVTATESFLSRKIVGGHFIYFTSAWPACKKASFSFLLPTKSSTESVPGVKYSTPLVLHAFYICFSFLNTQLVVYIWVTVSPLWLLRSITEPWSTLKRCDDPDISTAVHEILMRLKCKDFHTFFVTSYNKWRGFRFWTVGCTIESSCDEQAFRFFKVL